MTRIACPFCAFDIAVKNSATMAVATVQVLDHVSTEHPGSGVVMPAPGVVTAAFPEREYVPKGKISSMSLTISATADTAFKAYKMLGTVGGDLLMAGYDFSISKNEYDPSDPLPPLLDEFLHYDEDTLSHVMNALLDSGLTGDQSHAAINHILNAGIVFRERS